MTRLSPVSSYRLLASGDTEWPRLLTTLIASRLSLCLVSSAADPPAAPHSAPSKLRGDAATGTPLFFSVRETSWTAGPFSRTERKTSLWFYLRPVDALAGAMSPKLTHKLHPGWLQTGEIRQDMVEARELRSSPCLSRTRPVFVNYDLLQLSGTPPTRVSKIGTSSRAAWDMLGVACSRKLQFRNRGTVNSLPL